ncbi:MAG TPA: glutaredoxin domain-containing protein [Polyangia bacterium]|jgi:glutaredoxin|nr:glutaredoxin domain-containing protein [Polyangia bacterium]
MLNDLKEKLRALAHEKLEGTDRKKLHPVALHALNFVSIVNELAGRPIRGAEEAVVTPSSSAPATAAAPAPVVRPQAPVLVYFDGKDHRTRTKVEELLRGHDIVFKVLDVSDDEVERSWVTTAAKTNEFPIVVIGGTPVGGLHELVQLDVSGQLLGRVFGVQ